MEQIVGLSDTTLKNLSDKSVEKRKNASEEVKRMIKNFIEANKESEIVNKIKFFNTNLSDPGSQQKKIGLYGLTSIAIALYDEQWERLIDKIIGPILECCEDREYKVQLVACDSLYNIINAGKEQILQNKNFLKIFKKLVDLVADPHSEVKENALKLVQELQDIVQNALNRNCFFELELLIETISKKLKDAQSNDVQLMLIRWVETLHSLANVDISKCLPMFLYRLLDILNREQQHDASQAAHNLLKTFLNDYKVSPS